MPDPNQSAPPSFYNSMAQTGGGAAPPPPAGAPAAGGDDTDVLAAMAKMAGALKKIGKMKDGAQPYIDRMMSTMKELIVDVFKKDPKDLDAAGGDKPPTDNATPPPPEGNATPPPPPAGAPA